MKISYNWLKDFVDIPDSPQELGAMFDQLGLAVDGLDEFKGRWTKVVVGKVLKCEAVPMTAHLSYCEVDAGTGEILPIVCGAPNVAEGQTAPVALVGADLPDGFRIRKVTLKGVESHGMICSEKELGLSTDHSGVMLLPDDLPVGSPLEEHICKGDWVYDLEVTFNRPDWLSHLGVAREIAAKTGQRLKMPPAGVNETDVLASEKVSIEIPASDRCPRYSARIVEGVEIKPSPLWMQDRLRAVGVRPINNVVDVTNYILIELGHPLHAFDRHLVSQGKIVVRMAENGEKFVTLDEKKHTLESTDLLIADPEKGIALAGVMGGLNSEIQADTKDVLIECAYFDPVGTRITSRDRGIATESSRRFERGVDPEMTPMASSRAARLIQELAGGSVLKGLVDAYPKPWKPNRLNLRPDRTNKILSTSIRAQEMEQYLNALGCKVEAGDPIKVATPSWRHDLDREIDLIEEVARLHGYDKIDTAEKSSVPLIPDPERERERRHIDRFKSTMVELGFHEAITYSLIPSGDKEKFPIDKQFLNVMNPISDDLSVLRTSLGQTLIREIERNLKSGIQNIKLFEWGRCFWLENERICEEWRLGGVIAGTVRPEHWIEKEREFGFHDLKGVLETFITKILLDKAQFICYHIPMFLLAGGTIKVQRQNESVPIGVFGQIDAAIADAYDIDKPVWFFELNGEKLLELSGRTPQFKSLPRYPAALRDLAFVVDEKVEAGTVHEEIEKNCGELLEQVELFDLYKGEKIPEGKKSLAFHLSFRSADRTLSDNEIDSLIKRTVDNLGRDTGAVLRAI